MTQEQRHSVPLSDRRHEDREAIVTVLKEEIVAALREVMTETSLQEHALSAEEAHWVRLAIKAEVERAELRKAIIEKTLTGLIWSAVCVVGVYAWDHMTAYAEYLKK